MTGKSLIQRVINDIEDTHNLCMKVSYVLLGVRSPAEGSPITLQVFTEEGRTPQYFVKISRFPGQQFLIRENTQHEICNKILGKSLCDKFIKPLYHGNVEGHYYLAYPFKASMEPSGVRWRIFVKDKLFDALALWLTEVAKKSVQIVSKAKYDEIILMPLRDSLDRQSFPEDIKKAITISINALTSSGIQNKLIFQHRDLQKDNLIVKKAVPLEYYIIDMASSSFNGLYFADLLDIAVSLKINKKKLLKAVKSYAKALSVDPNLCRPFTICSYTQKKTELEHCHEPLYHKHHRADFYNLIRKIMISM